MKDLSLSCQKEAINKEADIKSAELDYQGILNDSVQSQANPASLDAKAEKIGNLYTQMQLILAKFREKARGILTEEQKTRLSYVPTPSPEGSHQGHPEQGDSHSGH